MLKKKLTVSVSFFLLLSSSLSGQESKNSSAEKALNEWKKSAEEKLINDAKSLLLKSLIDPESAKFENPLIEPADGSSSRRVKICLNAKNQMGGYAGRKPYVCEIYSEQYKNSCRISQDFFNNPCN